MGQLNDWGMIGAQGFYNQGLQNQMGAQNAFHQQASLGNYASSYNQYFNTIAQQQQSSPGGLAQTITSLFQNVEPAPELTPAQKKLRKKYKEGSQLKTFIERLRYEIDSWHGDILCTEGS